MSTIALDGATENGVNRPVAVSIFIPLGLNGIGICGATVCGVKNRVGDAIVLNNDG